MNQSQLLREFIDAISEASGEEVQQYASKFIPQRLKNICVPYKLESTQVELKSVTEHGFILNYHYHSLDNLVPIIDNIKRVDLSQYPFMEGFHGGLIEVEEVFLTQESFDAESQGDIQFWAGSGVIVKELEHLGAHESGVMVLVFSFEQHEEKMDTVVSKGTLNLVDTQAQMVLKRHPNQPRPVSVEYNPTTDVIMFLGKEFIKEPNSDVYTTDFIDNFYLTLPKHANTVH